MPVSMAIRPDLDAPSPALADASFFGHPRGLATLFFTEMWERFSYYGMRALLILFMTAGVDRGGLGFPVPKAGAIYGLYTAMVYLLSLPGGWVADRITGQRRAVLYGGILIACGQFCLMGPSITMFYLGLVVLVLGTGLLKPNVSTIVGQLYGSGDHRRDAGFSIFYMGINLGALISPLACGWVGERIGWRLGFGLAGVGMIAGVIQYVLGGRYLGSAGLRPAGAGNPEQARRQKRRGALGGLGALALFAAVGALAATGRLELTPQIVSNGLGAALVLITVAIFSWLLAGRGWSRHGAQEVGRHPGPVSGRGRVLGGLRAGRFVAQPLCPAQHRPPRVRLRVSGQLVPVRAAVLHHHAGARVRLAVGEAGVEGAF